MGIYPFRPKQIAKCPCFETIKQNVPILKLDLIKIKLLAKCYMELKFHVIFFFFLSFLPDFLKIEFFIEIRFLENRV